MTQDTSEARHRRLTEVRPRLVSFALMHLRDLSRAEDAVQEALTAALEKDGSFAGRSGYETWVFGILKYKILDAMRAQKRQGIWQPLDDEGDDEAIERQFQQNGRWQKDARPSSWGRARGGFRERALLASLRCLHDRPAGQRRQGIFPAGADGTLHRGHLP
ncbi:sigma factor [Halomonas jincaotanensis]|uniref:sigma factor n=1 Tax=Halomonas jincaotanensis TaxID=2810616 RepID=UPI0029E7FE77|nr:sigma factor [Halomonas jincaotanensis]